MIMLLSIKVTPNAKKPEIREIGENEYAVKLDATPDKGKANAKLIEVLSDHFSVPKSAVRILKGQRSRKKLVEIDSLPFLRLFFGHFYRATLFKQKQVPKKL